LQTPAFIFPVLVMRTAILKTSSPVILVLISLLGYGQKTDKVYLKNGDVVTGEMKSMKLAKLSFDMNGPGIISIKWEEIVRINSSKTYEVTLQNGQVLLTKLDTLFFETQNIKLDDIVEIVKIRQKFLKRLEGDVNIGFNYTKSSDIIQFNLASAVTYRRPKVESTLRLNTVLSRSSDDTITSKKQDASIGNLRTLNNRFYFLSALGWERNTQLGLANRYQISASGGKFLLNNNRQRLLTGIGLSYNEERFYENTGYVGNVETMAAIQYKKFHYSFPKLNIDAVYIIYPSLSNWGRVRMNLQLNTSLEVFKDFTVGLTFYDNFDNRPSETAASTNDYGLTFSVGFIFGK